MKVLIISPLFYPNNTPRAFRSFELTKELARMGHQVVVYTDKGVFNYTGITDNYKFTVKNLPNLKFYKAGNSSRIKYSIFERVLMKILKYPLYFPEIELAYRIPYAIKNESFYDLIISIAVPHSSHIGTALALKENINLATIWIADCGDPFFKNKFNRHPFYFRYVEKWMFKKANYIAIPTIKAKISYPKEVQDKIRIIPQGFDFSNVKLYPYKKNPCLTFAYAGMLYKNKRDPSRFLDYLVSIKCNFKFIVYTRNHRFFEKYNRQLQNKLVVTGYIERNRLIYELSKMDFLVNFENDTMEHVPSKLIDYYLSSRPILNVSSVKLDIQTIEEFFKYNYANQHEIPDLESYNITNVAKKFVELSN